MNSNLTEMRDFILDYNLVNGSIGFVVIETAIIALIIGSSTKDIGWGIGSFIIMLLLYGVPLIGGIFALVFSFVEAIVIGAIVSILGTSLGWSYFIGIIAFVLLTNMHRIFGAVDNPVLFGYSYLIFNDILINGILYILYGKVSLVIFVFVTVLIVAFIPVLRIAELIVLGLGTTVFVYLGTYTFLGIWWQALLIAGFVLIYSGYSYYCAYVGVDYVGMVQSRKKQKMQAENANKFSQIKWKLYNQYPELEKNYYYFHTEVCRTDFAKMQFDYDWNNYLKYLDETADLISFNDFFEQKKLYRSSHYNSDFARKHSEWNESNPFESSKANEGSKKSSSTYFVGVDSLESLKKRYDDLLRIYHPNGQNGDTVVAEKIQQEYEELLKKFEEL